MVTEGKITERQYVEMLVQRLRNQSIAVSVKSLGIGKDPMEVVKACVDQKSAAHRNDKSYDEYVCLVDHDEHTTLYEAMEYAAREDIKFIVSNLKFELWLLWHVEDVRSNQNSKELDRKMKQHKLLDDKHLAAKFPIDNYQTAVKIADQVDPQLAFGRIGPNPSSAMPELVRLLHK